MKNFRKLLKRYFCYISDVKTDYIISVICSTLMAILNILQPLFLGKLVDSLDNGNREIKYLIIFMGIFFMWNVSLALRDYFANKVSLKKLDQSSRIDYLEKLMKADYSYHMDKSSGELISLSDRALTVFYELYWGLNLWIFQIVIEFALATYYLFSVDLSLGLIMIISLVSSFLVTLPIIKRNVRYNEEANDKDDEVKGIIADNLTSFETVKLFGQEDFEKNRLKNLFKKWEKAKLKYAITYSEIDMAVYAVTLTGSAVMMFFVYNNVVAGIWTAGFLVTAFGYVSSVHWKSFDLIYKYRRLLKLNSDIEKYINVMELEPTIKDIDNPERLESISGSIDFRNIVFSYKGKDKKEEKEVIHNISLHIHPDETVAFVGKSGSGKTTLTKLLMRFYAPQSGNIYIDGKNLKDVKLSDLRKAIGIVPQDPILFNETIKFNIAYGKPESSLEEIESAAKKASLDDFIQSLPQKYDTIVGERGIKLSGGQRQRLAIARAILYNPEIIVFDEATSQLDSENERTIQNALDNLKKKKTTIIIAHRLSTVMKADRIIVFDEGRIVEEGKHEELMKNNGIYSHLWELQTEYFN